MKSIGLLLLMMLLTSCSSGSTLEFVHTCPVTKDYTAAQKTQAKQEAALLPENSEIGEMLKDYSVLKAAANDCEKVK